MERVPRGHEPLTDTVVFFHADPDDEAIFTGGTMAMLFAAAPVDEAGDRLAGLLSGLGRHSLVIYDGGGIHRAAMAAHGSQIPESSSTWQLPGASFAAVYGLEWRRRVGASGPLDRLPA